jgi:alpha-1,3/alpha-1,6-mannosyltransferase
VCIQVCFLPSFSDQQRSALLAACTALLYTPTNEHFGIVPLEAMACGRPVIACNSGGPRETIVNAITGFLCEPQPQSFAAAMRKLLVHPASLALWRREWMNEMQQAGTMTLNQGLTFLSD